MFTLEGHFSEQLHILAGQSGGAWRGGCLGDSPGAEGGDSDHEAVEETGDGQEEGEEKVGSGYHEEEEHEVQQTVLAVVEVEHQAIDIEQVVGVLVDMSE